jgi:hypothetical protein
MYIERNRLIQLNKDIFGGGIRQTKKLAPDYKKMIMPDPSLPKIKRFNIRSNNPLGYLVNSSNQMPIQSQMPVNIQPQEIEEQQQSEKDIVSQNINGQINEEEINENQNIQEQLPVTQVVEAEPTTKKYTFTDFGENNVLLPPGYSTDDELEFKLVNLINEPRDKYTLAVESSKYETKVYKRPVSNNIFNYLYIE